MRISATLRPGVYPVERIIYEAINYADAVNTAYEWETFGIDMVKDEDEDAYFVKPEDIVDLFCGAQFQ